MRYYGVRCARCGGLAMTDTNGNGGLLDICPVCDWGWAPRSYAPPPPESVSNRRGGRKPGVYNLGSFQCADCRRIVTRRSSTHKRCDRCGARHNKIRDQERGAALTARRRHRRAMQRGRMQALRNQYAGRVSRFEIACA